MLVFLLTFVQKNVLMFVNHDCCVDPGEMRAPTLFPSCLPDLIDSSISAEELRQLPCKAKMSRTTPLPAPDKKNNNNNNNSNNNKNDHNNNDNNNNNEEQRQLPCKAKMSRSAPLPAPDKN